MLYQELAKHRPDLTDGMILGVCFGNIISGTFRRYTIEDRYIKTYMEHKFDVPGTACAINVCSLFQLPFTSIINTELKYIFENV